MHGGAPARKRMVSLGKVAAPKPLNLPSQKKENNGNDPSVNLISKSGGWGSAGAGAAPADDAAGKHPERAIPAQPTPAWGGAGLPEERKKQVEMAAQQEFPVLGDERGPPGRHGPHDRYGYHDDDPRRRGPWDADERGPYAGPPDDGPYRGRYYERGPYHPMDRPPYDRYERYGRFDGPPGPYERERFGERDRYGPPRHYGPPDEYEDYGPPRPRRGYYDGPGPEEREFYHRHPYVRDGPYQRCAGWPLLLQMPCPLACAICCAA
ncbi:hypothetical protein COHA_007446 [Chlorella ohadii]|uniref:BAT2 N-terminal domain-containing protein n=1 Tax=Chlorella ohadii TaxID=2649997 RepID=A0AAD5DIW0_9CHLO|nr:hypothetical protein COHA_007446 [Chlorella ohadii]